MVQNTCIQGFEELIYEVFGFDSRPTRGEDVKMNSCLGSKIVAALEVFNCMWDSRLDCVL
jgi:hypothetical protein